MFEINKKIIIESKNLICFEWSMYLKYHLIKANSFLVSFNKLYYSYCRIITFLKVPMSPIPLLAQFKEGHLSV